MERTFVGRNGSLEDVLGTMYDVINDNVVDDLMNCDIEQFSHIMTSDFILDEILLWKVELFIRKYYDYHLMVRFIYFLSDTQLKTYVPTPKSDFRSDFIQRAQACEPIIQGMRQIYRCQRLTYNQFMRDTQFFESFPVKIELEKMGYDFKADAYHLKQHKYDDFYEKQHSDLVDYFQKESYLLKVLVRVHTVQKYMNEFDFVCNIEHELWQDFKYFHKKFLCYTLVEFETMHDAHEKAYIQNENEFE